MRRLAMAALAAAGLTLLTAGAWLAQDPGQALFEGKGNCFACHGKDGTGTALAPDLTDSEWLQFDHRPSLEEVEALVRTGVAQPKQHPAPMPPMGGARLSDEEIQQVAQYVLGLSEDGGSGGP